MTRMKKTTVYLTDELKRALEHAAADRQCSEADLIREAVQAITRGDRRPRPRLPLFKSGRRARGLAERIDRALDGFGTR